MADAIAARIDPASSGSTVSQYVLDATTPGTYSLVKTKGPNPTTGGNMADVIVKVNWTTLSQEVGTADYVGFVVATALCFPPTDGTFNKPFVELPLHFIGHSRGAYVNSAAIQELGGKGIGVDHCTILDGQSNPPGTDADGFLEIWTNIRFADNYYQNCPAGNFSGFSIAGTFEKELKDLVGFCSGSSGGSSGAHSRVHTFYHGTIDLNTNSVDGQDIFRNFWYGGASQLGQQPEIGFYFSDVVPDEFLKSGLSSGLASYFGGAAIRTIVNSDGSPQWPNIVLQNRDNVWTVTNGATIRIHYPYSDIDSQTTITFATDDDRNPYNNPPGNEVATFSKSLTQGGPIPDVGVFPWILTTSHNNRYLYAKITEANNPLRSRCQYLAQKFTVTSTPPPDPPPPPNQGIDLTRSSALVWDDHGGDKDGAPEAGETVGLKVRLRNNSTSVLRNVRGTLSSSFGNVQIGDSLTLYGDLNPSQAFYGSGDYDMLFNFGSTTVVPFHLRATYMKDNVEYYQDWDFSTTIYQNGGLEPQFAVDHVVWDDAPPNGDGDGVIESGENPSFRIWLKNTGNATATEVRATISDVVLLKVRDETLDYPNLVAGGNAQGPTGDFDLDERIPKGFAGLLTADVVVKYSGNELQKVIFDYPLFNIKPAAWIRVSPERYDFGISPTTTNVMVQWTIRNAGSTNMNVTAITSTNADTTWAGDALPWNIAAGDSKTIVVTIATSNLQGPITRSLVVTTDARIQDVGEDDRIILTGLVGDTVPLEQIPNVTGASHPDISGDWIVWMDGSSGNADIYSYNLATGEKRQITTDTNDQFSPFISGNLIVWSDKRDDPTNSYYDVYAYDLTRPDLGEFRVTPALSSGRSQVLGVDSNRVALFHVYEWLYDSSSPDAANNLYSYEYQGNGQFTNRYTTGFTPGSGTQIRQTVNGPDHGSDADFGEGMLTFEQGEIYWHASGTWQEQNWTTRVINFADNSSNREAIDNNGPSRHSAAANRFVFEETNVVWMWREPGTVQQLTFNASLGYADDVLGIGGPDGSDVIVYDYGSSTRPGLYYLDRSDGEEYLISSSVDPDDLRMDGLRVVFRDKAASNAVKYIFLKQPDVSISPANITFDNDSPLENTTVNVSVTVQNLTTIEVTNSITVRLYDGDPDFGGVQLGTDRVISGGLGAQSQATVTFNSITVFGAGTHNIYARLTSAVIENPANNKASKPLNVIGVTPTVSMDLIEPLAYENGPNHGSVLIYRTGLTNSPLAVDYTTGGTASNGVDYSFLTGSLVIPAGSTFATLFVSPINDTNVEGNETVILTISTNGSYNIGSANSSIITIQDNDFAPRDVTFDSPNRLPDGSVRLDLTGNSERSYVIEASSDLMHWVPLLTTNVDINGHIEFVDLEAANLPTRFYRARLSSCVSLAGSIIGWWSGDGNADDNAGTNHGTLRNGTTFAAGEVGQGFSFDGIDDFIDILDSSLWNFGTNDFTIEFWFAFTTPGRAILAANGEGAGSAKKWLIEYWESPGRLHFHINDAVVPTYPVVYTGFSPVPGSWYHFAVTRNGANFTLYLDGAAVAAGIDSTPIPDADGPLTIGNGQPQETSYPLSGLIDEFAIYNRALSVQEIKGIYDAATNGKCKGQTSN